MGNFIQSGGIMFVDGGTLDVKGDYRIQKPNGDGTYTGGSGLLKMMNASDSVIVDGDFVIDSSKKSIERIGNSYNYHYEYYLSAGVLEIKGDFIQQSTAGDSSGDSSPKNFNTYGTHKVV
ncbi:MAG: hypothetical protein BBJ57_03915, partial [Desulfobacterales bacterium PC51MH44]